ALVLVGVFFTRPYRRLGLNTIGELFQQRYNSKRCGWLTSLCVQTEYFVVNIIEPLLIGIILSHVLGIELLAGIAIGSAVIIVATTISGLKGASFTNIIHCLMILAGLGTVALVAANQMGGWHEVIAKANGKLSAAEVDSNQWWSLAGMGLLPIVAMFFSATIHTPATSVYVNFSSSARNEKVLIPAFLIAGVAAAMMSLVSIMIGIEAVGQYGVESGLSGYNSITRIALDTGPLIGGIATAAVLAALISSGGPILLASSTMVVNDWIPGSTGYSHVRKLRAYRLTSVLYGLLAALIACYFGYVVGTASILQLLLLGYAMVVPPAIAIGNIFYVRAITEQAVFWGIATGYGLGLLAWCLNRFVWQFGFDITAYVTTLVPLFAIPNISLWMYLQRPGVNPVQRRQMLKLLLLCYLVAALAWLANQQAGWLHPYLCSILAASWPMLLIPTACLVRLARHGLNDAERDFYRRLSTVS
ncbi:MAG TPA: hypothetical protein VJN01_07515, partial [Xanthomonadales bacterium]|nr:hypothetical protein [Xanthomonadales bacterium]